MPPAPQVLKKRTLLQRLFSCYNEGVHRVVCLLGVKFTFRSRVLQMRAQMAEMERELARLKGQVQKLRGTRRAIEQPSPGGEVEIAVIADNGFMVPSIVMLTSAKLNKKATSRYKIHFVCVMVSGYFKKKLLELSSPDFKIRIHNADTERYSGVHISSHVTSSTFLKLDLTTILPEVDKVLHLDGDALVYGDLWELFQTDIDQCPLGVVRALSLEHNDIIYKRTGRAKRAFNAGVMLMNLKRWREMNASEELHSMLDRLPREWVCLEQDCMNVFFHDNAKYLPLKYNVIPYVFQNRKLTMQQINEFYGTSYRNQAEMCDDAVILHLAGTPGRRPWEVINGVHGNVWQYYYDRSPLRHHYLARKVFNFESRRDVSP